MIAIDTETYPFSPGNQLPRIVCLTWADESGKVGIYLHDDARRYLATLLRSGEHIVGHSVSYDMGCAMTNWPELVPDIIRAYEEDRIKCTRLWSKLWHNVLGIPLNKGRTQAKGYWGLARLCERWDIPPPDKANPWRTRYNELDGVSLSDWPADALQYALYDAACTMAVAQRMPSVPDVAGQSRWDTGLRLSSAYGMRTDQPKVVQWAIDLEAERARIGAELLSAGLVREGASGKRIKNQGALRSRVIDSLGDRAPKTAPSSRHPNGQVKFDSRTCLDTDDPLLHQYARYSGICAALDRELPMLREPYVHTFYDLAATGRSTSGRDGDGRGGNMQNMTKASGSRQCFRTHRDDQVFCFIDFSGLELSTLGELCVVMGTGDKLASAIRDGRDAHAEFGASLLGIPVDRFDRRNPEHAEARQNAKDANFGYPGGAGWRAYQASVWQRYGRRIDDATAKQLRRGWRRMWPDAVRYQKLVDQCLNGLCLQCARPTMSGTQCPECGSDVACGTLVQYLSGRIRGGLTYTSGCNTLFQGLGGDVTKATLWALTKAGFSVSAFVHDEYGCEVERRHAVEAAHEIRRICESTARAWLPHAPPKAEPVLTTRWIKADPLVINGELRVIDADAGKGLDGRWRPLAY